MEQTKNNKQDDDMPLDKRSDIEIEEENLKKTMDITRGIMEAGESEVFRPVKEGIFQRSLEKVIRFEPDKKQDSEDS